MKVFRAIFIVLMALSATLGFSSELEFDTYKVDYPTNEAQKQCMEEEWEKFVQKYPELKPWFEDSKNTGEQLRLENERCATLHAVKKIACFAKLKSTELMEYARLYNLLPSTYKFVLSEVNSAVKGCMKASFSQ